MAQIGKVNSLKALRSVSIGFFLDGGTLGDLLLPQKYVPENLAVGDQVDVFVYLDSEDRLIATTEAPFAQVGDFALLKAVAVNKFGAFLDWGLVKNLMVPFGEQKERIVEGKHYLVYVYIDDNTKRLVASTKIEKFLDNLPPDYKTGEQVQLIIAGKTEIGYKAVINNLHTGMLYFNQVFSTLTLGQKLTGYIQKVREDDKIDLQLQKIGYEKIVDISEIIIDKLKENKGYLAVTDKSSSDEIALLFGMSKKNFKKSIGALYKNRLIILENDGIRLV